MAAPSNLTKRPAAKKACIYWSGTRCTADTYFNIADISCYSGGDCDGAGTCRECTKYDAGGLKFDAEDGQGAFTQQPLNLQIYNVRASIQTCCHWQGGVEFFSRRTQASEITTTARAYNAAAKLLFVESTENFPSYGTVIAAKDGAPTIYVNYSSKAADRFINATITPPTATIDDEYQVTVPKKSLFPVLLPNNATAINPDEVVSKCSLAEARPWQEPFTEENPTAYGCNGAKPECPYYTGPRFDEVVDAKMDKGDRVSAKQILELRFYSDVWKDYSDPLAVWNSRFNEPYIWAYYGNLDTEGLPRLQKISIVNLGGDTFQFEIAPPVSVHTGTETQGEVPDYPDLVKQVSQLDREISLIWPRRTSLAEPYVKKVFTAESRVFPIVAMISSDRECVAVNLTKHNQDDETDVDFIEALKSASPDDVIYPSSVEGFFADVFLMPLEFNPLENGLNHIRIFLDKARVDGSMETIDVYIRHKFLHSHIAQTKFHDLYGHTAIDPWIDHFNQISIEANHLPLTSNTSVSEILWNTVAANGKKTVYAIEEVVEYTTDDESSLIEVESVGCGLLALTFKDPNINRVCPWKAWETTEKGEALYVRVDRTENSSLSESEPTLIECKPVYYSVDGTELPHNVVFFAPKDVTTSIRKIEPGRDIVRVKYAYTKYKQGPISTEDLSKLKYPEDAEDAVISRMPYSVDYSTATEQVLIQGPSVKVGNQRIYSCKQVIGDCYSGVSIVNEFNARVAFREGGVNDPALFTIDEMQDQCIELFNQSVLGQFLEDGTPASFDSVSAALAERYLDEGTQRYTFFIQDDEGEVVGIKHVSFLTQSAVVQTRDVEIRYKWESQVKFYSPEGRLLMQAFAANPTVDLEQEGLVTLPFLSITYDPYCGDHAELEGNDFDLAEDGHGPLWYPYKSCLIPVYKEGGDRFDTTFGLSGVVEGFFQGKRRKYWERMRVWDQYMPIIFGYWGLPGCFWTQWDGNLHSRSPFNFVGYTRIRSNHKNGPYSTDRESIRLSRHFEKRNLKVSQDLIPQETGSLTLDLSDDLAALMFDENGDLNTGEATEYPIWVHMSDALSFLKVASEEEEHPFTHYLLLRSGTHQYGETYVETRLPLKDVFVEKDYTTTDVRLLDGSLPYEGEETSANTEEGEPTLEVGRDIQWVFKDKNTAWAWFNNPDEPVRAVDRITGLFLYNPTSTYLKKNFESATHATEGNHTVHYTAPVWNDQTGVLERQAQLWLDEGPHQYINWDDGALVTVGSDPSPYVKANHAGSDYEFVLYGNGTDGVAFIADSRGLQRFEVENENYATFAGLAINSTFNVNELPYRRQDASLVGRIVKTCVWNSFIRNNIDDVLREFPGTEDGRLKIDFDFRGKYYVEDIEMVFRYGGDLDVPDISISGVGSFDGAVYATESTAYARGDAAQDQSGEQTAARDFVINRNLKSLSIIIGKRQDARRMRPELIRVWVRVPEDRDEVVFISEPRVTISTADSGSHKPSDLMLYFRRTYDAPFEATEDQTTRHMVGRTIKDLVPQYEFNDPLNNRFPYENIDLTAIEGYMQDGSGYKYIGDSVAVCSKGYTMYTTDHSADADTLNHPNSFRNFALEDKQEELYESASALLGDKVSVYNSFWHPAEIEFFEEAGVQLEEFTWTLELRSTVASLDTVFRNEDYGCTREATTEDQDGKVHPIDNWQAKGAWYYTCNPRYNERCFDVLMNKCVKYLYTLYGTPEYLENDISSKYTYIMTFPPNDEASYIAAGLVDKPQTYIGGSWGGVSLSSFYTPYLSSPTNPGGPPVDPDSDPSNNGYL